MQIMEKISWEEEAFAEDSLGPFNWPPRSYSCSFCNREFRSAQALGGHMNVHRRDRAKLQQSSDKKNDEENPTHHAFKLGTNTSSFQAMFYQESSLHHHGYNLHVSPSPAACSCKTGTDEISYSNKRAKRSEVPSLKIFQKTSSMEEIDLELRLGDPPAVK